MANGKQMALGCPTKNSIVRPQDIATGITATLEKIVEDCG